MKNFLFSALFTLSFIALSRAQTVNPSPEGIIYVNHTSSGDGSSWDDAAPSLADALLWVYLHKEEWSETKPAIIYVAKGIYKPGYSPEDGENFGTDQGRENSFLIGSNTRLYGGFDPGKGVTEVGHTRIFGSGGSILSGDFGDNDIIEGEGAELAITGNDENAYHVLTISANWQYEDGGIFGKNTVVDGFTITGGNANGPASPNFMVNKQPVGRESGAGIMIDGFHSLTLTDLIITGNTASGNGGGVRSGNLLNEEGHRPVFTRLTITRNAANYGGGMHGTGAFSTLTHSTVSGNKARYDAGGVRNLWSSASEYHIDTNPAFSEVTIYGNHAGRDGGGMANSLMSPSLHTVTISHNSSGRNGGGIYNYDRSSPRLTNVQITDNTAGDSGGGMHNYTNSSPVMNGVSFFRNTAEKDGGGIYNRSGSSPTLDNVTIDHNTANRTGGGMYSEGGATSSSPILNEVTISNNQAGENAGGLYFSGQSVPRLTEVLITRNSAERLGGGTYIQGAHPEFRKVTISLNAAGTGGGGMYNASNADPRLEDVEITGNTAGTTLTSGSGGGIYNYSAYPVLLNVRISGNSAGFGGGIMFNSASGGVHVNVLIAGNLAGSTGGGVYNWTNSRPTFFNVTLAGNKSVNAGGATIYNDRNSALTTLRNSIVWGNSGGISYASQSPAVTITHSLVQGWANADQGNISASDILDEGDGGSLFTTPHTYANAPTLNGDYTLKPGTEVMNRGNKAYYEYSETDLVAQYLSTLGITTDLAGNPRLYGPQMDMGAYELIHESALPVTLVRFSVESKEGSNYLSWQTTEEAGASFFEVQRSADAATFEGIGIVRAKGDSKELTSYTFTDPDHLSWSHVYYRLRMVDHDGSFTYSPIVVARRTPVSEPFRVYPNPASDMVMVEVPGYNRAAPVCRVTDLTGRVVLEAAGPRLDLRSLPAGLYFIKPEGNNLPAAKILIQR